MQFALLVSKICLAYFIDLLLLISVHDHIVVPFLILPLFPCTRQSVVGRAPSHGFIYIYIYIYICIYIVFPTMLGSVLQCGVFFSCFVIFFILYLSGLNMFFVLYLVYNTWTCAIIISRLVSDFRVPFLL